MCSLYVCVCVCVRFYSSATYRTIPSTDHASVQINIGHVDENGVYTHENTTYAFGGYIRRNAESDASLTKLAAKDGLIRDIFD